MSYIEQQPPSFSVGCFPAAVFGVVVGMPSAILALMGECIDEDGLVGSCPNDWVILLAITAVTATGCFLVRWATDRMVAARATQDKPIGWGIAGGFMVAAALVLMLFGLLALLK
jgi:hypothetical protein